MFILEDISHGGQLNITTLTARTSILSLGSSNLNFISAIPPEALSVRSSLAHCPPSSPVRTGMCPSKSKLLSRGALHTTIDEFRVAPLQGPLGDDPLTDTVSEAEV